MPARVLKFDWAMFCPKISAGNVELYDCGPHFHDTFTIAAVKTGPIQLRVNNERYSLEQGDAFLIHPYQVHSGGNNMDVIACDILYPSIEFMSHIADAVCPEGFYPHFSAPVIRANKDTLFLSETMRELSGQSAESANDEIYTAVARLFAKQTTVSKRLSLPDHSHPAVHRACEIIFNELASPDALSDLWERVGISRYHFVRVFHKNVGLSPSAFIRQLRVAKARDLMAKGGVLVDIAMEAGFYDQAHMSREFRNVFGYPPSKYAREFRQTRL